MPDIDTMTEEGTGQVVNHCPFGCEITDMDENGYCCHLVGFTNTPKVGGKVECVDEKRSRPSVEHPKGEFIRRFVNGKKVDKVQSKDVLVNPTHTQRVNGIAHIARAWVSTRVYRENMPAWSKAEDVEDQLEELTRPG